MLSKEQEKILELLKELWNRNTTQRLGQLLENYIFYQGERGDKTSIRLFHQQDEETLKILEWLLEQYKKNYGELHAK
jgi:FPC/CPF motif-containing protein YcgG